MKRTSKVFSGLLSVRPVVVCGLLTLWLLWGTIDINAQRPRVGIGAQRLERQQQKVEKQAGSNQEKSNTEDAGEAQLRGQGGAANRFKIGPDQFTGDEVAQLPRGLGLQQMRALLRVFRQLDLSAEQRQKLRELSRRYGNQLPVLTRLHRAQNEALDEAIYGTNFDPKLVEQRAADVAATQAEIVKTRARIMSEVRQVLTPEQSAKFRTLLEQERLRMLQESRTPEPGQF